MHNSLSMLDIRCTVMAGVLVPFWANDADQNQLYDWLMQTCWISFLVYLQVNFLNFVCCHWLLVIILATVYTEKKEEFVSERLTL